MRTEHLTACANSGLAEGSAETGQADPGPLPSPNCAERMTAFDEPILTRQ